MNIGSEIVQFRQQQRKDKKKLFKKPPPSAFDNIMSPKLDGDGIELVHMPTN